MIFGLPSCGGKEKKSKKSKTVSWKKVSHFGVTLKVPKTFQKNPASGSDSVQYMYKGGMAYIVIEKTDGYEEGLEKYLAEQYEKRERKTDKRFKDKDAYKILKKDTELTLGGKKAFEIEHEYRGRRCWPSSGRCRTSSRHPGTSSSIGTSRNPAPART
jgi:hypothetical protein